MGRKKDTLHVKCKIFSTFTHIHPAHLFTQYAFISISFSLHSRSFALKRLCSISSSCFHLGPLNFNEGTDVVQHYCRSTTLQLHCCSYRRQLQRRRCVALLCAQILHLLKPSNWANLQRKTKQKNN